MNQIIQVPDKKKINAFLNSLHAYELTSWYKKRVFYSELHVYIHVHTMHCNRICMYNPQKAIWKLMS